MHTHSDMPLEVIVNIENFIGTVCGRVELCENVNFYQSIFCAIKFHYQRHQLAGKQ